MKWINANERLPSEDGSYYILDKRSKPAVKRISNFSTNKLRGSNGSLFYIRPYDIEWLEESEQIQNNNLEIRKDIFGYFDKDNGLNGTPTHDPGLETICPFCVKKLSRPLKTISLMKDGDSKSYFYRTHKDCYENASEDEICEIESSLIDNL